MLQTFTFLLTSMQLVQPMVVSLCPLPSLPALNVFVFLGTKQPNHKAETSWENYSFCGCRLLFFFSSSYGLEPPITLTQTWPWQGHSHLHYPRPLRWQIGLGVEGFTYIDFERFGPSTRQKVKNFKSLKRDLPTPADAIAEIIQQPSSGWSFEISNIKTYLLLPPHGWPFEMTSWERTVLTEILMSPSMQPHASPGGHPLHKSNSKLHIP